MNVLLPSVSGDLMDLKPNTEFFPGFIPNLISFFKFIYLQSIKFRLIVRSTFGKERGEWLQQWIT